MRTQYLSVILDGAATEVVVHVTVVCARAHTHTRHKGQLGRQRHGQLLRLRAAQKPDTRDESVCAFVRPANKHKRAARALQREGKTHAVRVRDGGGGAHAGGVDGEVDGRGEGGVFRRVRI